MSPLLGRLCRGAAVLLLLPAHVPGAAAQAVEEQLPAAQPPVEVQQRAIHGQFTYTEQGSGDFRAPYRGPNSLSPDRGAETVDVTLFAGTRLWSGSELWIAPEVDQGFGLDDTLGVAGFPSGEAYKVGANQPYVRLQRLFVRQTIDLGGRPERIEPAALQLGGAAAPDRLVVTAGKISVVDIFDNNRYAHDPRSDFLNWSAIDAGTFDYAADAWGYSVGAAIEWYRGPWALRFGVFDLSDVPNSTRLEPAFHEFQYDAELERAVAWRGRPGKLRLTMFDSRGRMALLGEAVARAEATGTLPDLAAVRSYRSRLGAHLGLEQELAENVGLFARIGKEQGNVETYEFTDIDRSVSAGLSFEGARWRRPGDGVGLAGMLNGISADRQRYLGAGGLGVLIGDGRLPNAGPEKILESYYSVALLAAVHLSFDYQFVTNPAYNRDRGPVSLVALRLHAQF